MATAARWRSVTVLKFPSPSSYVSTSSDPRMIATFLYTFKADGAVIDVCLFELFVAVIVGNFLLKLLSKYEVGKCTAAKFSYSSFPILRASFLFRSTRNFCVSDLLFLLLVSTKCFRYIPSLYSLTVTGNDDLIVYETVSQLYHVVNNFISLLRFGCTGSCCGGA